MERTETNNRTDPISVPWVAQAPARGERLVMMTAYDFRQARLVEQAGADIVLVGDSLAMVVLGHRGHSGGNHGRDAAPRQSRAARVETALLVADMPYGSFHLGLSRP